MSELDDMLNSVLNDPEQMNRIMGLAQSLMGGESAAQPELPDMAMLTKLGSVLRRDDSKQALFEAMKPYLSEKRRGKLDRAMKLARLTRIAGVAFGEIGGSDV